MTNQRNEAVVAKNIPSESTLNLISMFENKVIRENSITLPLSIVGSMTRTNANITKAESSVNSSRKFGIFLKMPMRIMPHSGAKIVKKGIGE